MAKPAPDYRTDLLDCPLNAGKLERVVELVRAMRRCAGMEAKQQWRQFFRGGWESFEASASKGWSRPWTKDQTLTVSHAQMVMSQVAASLQGHMGNVQNTYSDLVVGSTLAPNIRHQLNFINRRKAWLWKCDVALQQAVSERDPKNGKMREVAKKVVVTKDVRDLARVLIRKALSLHQRPHFRQFQPQIDQRSCFVQAAHSAQHELWLSLGLRQPGKRIDLPLNAHPGFLARQARGVLSKALSGLEQQSLVTAELPFLQAMQSKEAQLARVEALQTNSYPAQLAIAKTVRLILSEDRASLKVGVATDMRAVFEHSRATYIVKTPVLSMDVGLCTLIATDQGDLLGQSWLSVLTKFDALLTSIAQHRQRLGLPVKSERYIFHTQRLRGYLKTEINRVFNRLVAVRAPGHFILEALDFSNSQLSRRLNRILRNFGKGLITQKLLELEKQFGITTEFRNPAYSSQECSGCGYVDKRNRKTQSQFQCKFCNQKCHADVNGARVVRDRRSVVSSLSGSRRRVKTTLSECVSRFNERFPRPRGGPADPRFSNPYFKDWAAKVRSSESETPSLSQVCAA